MGAPDNSPGLPAAQRVVAAYEGKQAEVQREAAGLRAALEHLQKEHRALVNQQVRACAAVRCHCICVAPQDRATRTENSALLRVLGVIFCAAQTMSHHETWLKLHAGLKDLTIIVAGSKNSVLESYWMKFP